MRDVVETMVGFARTLRAAGVDATPDRVQAMLEALDQLDVLSSRDAYWAGRLTLCGNPDDLERYDRGFAAYFSGSQPSARRQQPAVQVIMPTVEPSGDPGEGEPGEDESAPRFATASDIEVLRERDVTRLTAVQRDEMRRLLALLEASSALRRSRRFAPARRGRIDAHRTVRATVQRGGEPSRLYRRAHRRRPRRVVLLVDVSGSMTPYADALLRFAHATARSQPRGCEVFTVGTRLTRVTRELRHRDPDAAMAAVSGTIPDWSGGTRLGEEIKEFLDVWGQRGTARGAVAVVASDGWERGEAALLGQQMARLHRLAHRVVWVNPHKAQPGYQPLTGGMQAALPHVDDFVEGHSLGAFEELAGVIGRA